ncbi:MAG: sensor domain-containing diguanylate cyclase [Chloroflexota bacterium]
MDKNTRLSVLYHARKLLEEGNLPASDKEILLGLVGILIVSLEKFTTPEEWVTGSRNLVTEIVSSQALLAMLKQQADELDALKKLSLNLTSSLDLPTVLDAVVREAMRLVADTRTAHIFLFVDGKLEFGASLTSSGLQNRIFSEPRKNGLTYTVARGGEVLIVEDMKSHPLYKNTPSDWSGSIIGIPLKMGQQVLGVMNVSRTKTGPFSNAELRLLGLLADQAAVAISNASLHQIVSEKAYSDTVTGLPNRRALDERLEAEVKKAWRTGTALAVIMMDLDGFKQVNDTYGHDFGDQVLRASFNAISVSVRTTDFLARYGGDELTLILSQSDLQAAKLVTNKIIENIHKFTFSTPDGQPLQLGISGGIAIYPTHGKTASNLLRAADAALYSAKKHYRGTFVTAKGTSGPLESVHLNHKS